MSDHIPDNIGKRVDPEAGGSGDTKGKMHSISVQKSPPLWRKWMGSQSELSE